MQVVTIDLLADWRAHAAPLPEPRNKCDWRYFGTITIDGKTGALAWRAGSYGIGNGAHVRELGRFEQIKISLTLELHPPPGSERRPVFSPSQGAGALLQHLPCKRTD